jgi:LCP family protein required for cell wall assembly
VAIVLAAVALLVVGAAGTAYAYYQHYDQAIHPVILGLPSELRQDAPSNPGDPFYVAILGVDTSRPGQPLATGTSDTYLVARVDPAARRVSMFSIPRDTLVDIPGHGKGPLLQAMNLGGPKLVVETLRQFTTLPISDYVLVGFSGFKNIVDALGGVTVNVPVTIRRRDVQASSIDASEVLVPKGPRLLNGTTALLFVRAGHQSNETDYWRIGNQQVFVEALAARLSKSSVWTLWRLLPLIARSVETSISSPRLFDLARTFRGMSRDKFETATMPGTLRDIGGTTYVIPDAKGLSALIARMKAGGS